MKKSKKAYRICFESLKGIKKIGKVENIIIAYFLQNK